MRQLALAAGLNQPTLSRFLDGKTTAMDLKNLLALSEHLGVTVSQLIGETDLADDPRVDQLLRLWDKLPEAGREVLLVTAAALLAGAQRRNQ